MIPVDEGISDSGSLANSLTYGLLPCRSVQCRDAHGIPGTRVLAIEAAVMFVIAVVAFRRTRV